MKRLSFLTAFDRVMILARSKKSTKLLSITSFIESFIFPIPPDCILIPMCISRPKKAFYFAFLTTIFSVLGGVVGYIIGYVYSDFFFSNLTWVFDSDQLNEIVGWMGEWGGIIVLISGFSPIPYKVFTIASGITGLAFVPFLVASFVGRGLRFFLIGFIVIRGGENIEQKIRKNAEVLGWVTVLILLLYFSLTFLAK